jgi:hypothetical protein
MLFMSFSFYEYWTGRSGKADQVQNGDNDDDRANQPNDAVHLDLLCFSGK